MAKRFPLRGFLGLVLVAPGMAVTFARVPVRSEWTTPICRWGHILFADALGKRIGGISPLCDRRREFLLAWLPLSVLFWVVFEVVNHASGARSILTDLTGGRVERFLCGLQREFWNFWSASKWVYSAPFTESIRYFEMPMAGFLGFGPFALEYFAMYEFAGLLFRKEIGKPSEAIAWW